MAVGIVSFETTCWSNWMLLRKAFRRWISRRETSSTVLSSCVTLTAKLSTLACTLEVLAWTPSARFISSPNISSACLLRLDSCLIIFDSVPLFTPSRSFVSSRCSGSVSLDTWMGEITRFGNGIFPLHFLDPKEKELVWFKFIYLGTIDWITSRIMKINIWL